MNQRQHLLNKLLEIVLHHSLTGLPNRVLFLKSYLHNFPVNSLKIDKSFVQIIQENQQNLGLVPAMIGIAHSMEMTVIAEGIETQYQLAQLKKLGVAE